jgi:hypothetical protein
MSVTPDDATGQQPDDDPGNGPVDQAASLDRHLLDEPSHPLADLTDPWQYDAALSHDGFEAASIVLNVSEVVDLGTESIAGLEALVIHGQLGDVVHLGNEPGYAWARAENSHIPEGYDIYQATASGPGHDHGEAVYVLVQQDLKVVLEAA